MGRIPQLVQSAPAPVGIRPKMPFVPWFLLGGAPQPVAAYQFKSSTSPNGYTVVSLAAAYVNLANPGVNDAAPGVAPTWAPATGCGFNGTQYLATGIVPEAQAWTALVQFNNITGASRYLFGVIGNGSGMGITPNRNGNAVWYYSVLPLAVPPNMVSGNVGMANQTAYRNGLPETGTIPTWTGAAPTRDIYIGAYDIDATGLPAAHIIGNIQALAIYPVTLTPATVLAVSNGMAAL